MPHASARGGHPLFAKLPEETLRRLEIYEALLKKWQRAVNLVGPSALNDIWVRHFADSLQVAEAHPEARKWLDLGSGAGFPGLVIASKYADDPAARVHLVESSRRKCAFLREAARETAAPAIVHCGRIEDVLPELNEPIDVVSARALASLPTLLAYAEKFLDQGAIGVFPKGKLPKAELTASLTAGKYLITTIESKTCASSRIVLVKCRAG
ncbi:MAG: 16S rRNA (guanine(527)-N(7))-methyltransferase RsmG [Beijerinckiaceae bacterium]|nr:16S rRNA (guanine(527)-N(7))-methyltransferase RsmG [Beijerinckiaceae bacterium]MCI0736749.1 16S rRNA (guanine(527)-N(7))-methyltransferase RsmG [Beijerinckiaceae bacterium]